MKYFIGIILVFLTYTVSAQELSSKNKQKASQLLKEIEEAENSRDHSKLVISYCNLAEIYESADFKKSIEYYEKAITITTDPADLVNINLRIAQIYFDNENFSKTIKYSQIALKVAKEMQNKQGQYDSYTMTADANTELKKYNDAESANLEALRIALKDESRWKVTKTLNKLIKIYDLQKDNNKKNTYKKLLTERFEMIDIAVFGQKQAEEVKTELIDLKRIVSQIGNENEGLKDSLLSQITDIEQLQKAITALSDTLNAQQAALKQTNQELTKKQGELSRLENYLQQRNIALLISLAIILIIGFLAFTAYRNYSIKKRQHALLKEQREEILTKNEEITKKNTEITKINEELTGSIRYAERIQKALFPPVEKFNRYFPENFILFKPRDIVSGDFYWISEKNGKIVVTAVDCTGHSVPGAFMSVLGITFLDEIVNKNEILHANEILNKLRENIIKSFHQHNVSEQTKDGMDMGLIVYDPSNSLIEFAGAYNPMILIRKGEAIVYKADRKPVGFHDRLTDSFTNNVVEVQNGDRIYLSSDGFIDQFGGEQGKKFLINRFSQMLIDSSVLPMSEQKNLLEKTFESWRGNIDQVDDIVVLGIEINKK